MVSICDALWNIGDWIYIGYILMYASMYVSVYTVYAGRLWQEQRTCDQVFALRTLIENRFR